MSVIDKISSRRTPILASSVGLVVLSGLSYCTSLVRELFLVGSEYGSVSLDRASVVLTAATVVGSTVGLAAQMSWGTGRSVRLLRLGYWLLPFTGLALIPVVGTVPALAGFLCVLLADFHLFSQQAANRERLHLALAGALVASVFSVTFWAVVGASSIESILVGYVAGAAFQLGVARWAGAGAVPRFAEQGISAGRSVVVASLAIGHGLIAKILLLSFETGVVAAAGLAFNAISALSVILAYPFASAVLAGRKQMTWSLARVGVASVACGLLGVVLATSFEVEAVTDSRLLAGVEASLHILGLMLAALPLVVTTGVLLRTPAVLQRKGWLLIGALVASLAVHFAVGISGVLVGSIAVTVFAFVAGQTLLPIAFLRRGRALAPNDQPPR